jgi:hypothetical protein
MFHDGWVRLLLLLFVGHKVCKMLTDFCGFKDEHAICWFNEGVERLTARLTNMLVFAALSWIGINEDLFGVLGSSQGTIKVGDADINDGVSSTFEEAKKNGNVSTLLPGGG